MVEEFSENVSLLFRSVRADENPVHDLGFRESNALALTIVRHDAELVSDRATDRSTLNLFDVYEAILKTNLFCAFICLQQSIGNGESPTRM
jgi:hypothetical protein